MATTARFQIMPVPQRGQDSERFAIWEYVRRDDGRILPPVVLSTCDNLRAAERVMGALLAAERGACWNSSGLRLSSRIARRW